jgi:hypothetical protein
VDGERDAFSAVNWPKVCVHVLKLQVRRIRCSGVLHGITPAAPRSTGRAVSAAYFGSDCRRSAWSIRPDLVAVLRRPREVVFHKALLVIGRNEVERLGDTWHGQHGEVLANSAIASGVASQSMSLREASSSWSSFCDARRFEVPTQAFLRK